MIGHTRPEDVYINVQRWGEFLNITLKLYSAQGCKDPLYGIVMTREVTYLEGVPFRNQDIFTSLDQYTFVGVEAYGIYKFEVAAWCPIGVTLGRVMTGVTYASE